MGTIIVVGSINMDVVNEVEAFPQPGETIHGRGTRYLPGGKGANQAVAASRTGGRAAMIGAVGEDAFGAALNDSLAEAGVDTQGVLTKEGTSGLAFITVSAAGENQIILSAGSNGKLTSQDLAGTSWGHSDIVLLQNEIPWTVNVAAMEIAREQGAKVIYNPAPAAAIPAEAYQLIDTLVVNETEAETVSGLPVRDKTSAQAAARRLLAYGVRQVIVTLGSQGSCTVNAEGVCYEIAAHKVKPVDTTAAGDTFIGAYAAAISNGSHLPEALKFATAAAALAVTKAGAQSSIPEKSEVEAFLGH